MNNSDFPSLDEDAINYHFEGVKFNFPFDSILTSWLKTSISSKSKKLGFINFIFCNDSYLHELNIKYLNHDTFTDVITFSYSDDKLEGDVFISIERIRENAKQLNISFEAELHRVMIHGVLHLLGFNDKTYEDKLKMTAAENELLGVLDGMILDNN